MQTFRSAGFAPAPRAHAAPPTYGRRSPRRYGRLPVQGSAASLPATDANAAAGHESAFPWVDQEFEEYFFE